MLSPKVTVLLPVYNGEQYVHEAIKSILNQSFADFELLIVNDGSIDHSVEIIQSYSDPRIRLVHNEKNLKLIAALNKGLDLARGEYIARMDCDDISLPQRLEKQVKFMDIHHEVGICGSWLRQFSDNQERIWKAPSRDEEIRCEMLFNSALYHPTVIMRRSVLVDNHLHYEEFPHAEDYRMWLRIMEKSNAANLPEVLLRYRCHSKQIVNVHDSEKIRSADEIRRLQLRTLGIEPTVDEMQIHHDLSYWGIRQDKDFVLAVGAWLTKILNANQGKNIYDHKHFQHLLERRWLWVCNSSTNFGMWIWKTYWKSKLASVFPTSFYRQGRFLLKSLLRYQKKLR